MLREADLPVSCSRAYGLAVGLDNVCLNELRLYNLNLRNFSVLLEE